ncbi:MULTISPECIES: cell division initiation protein [Streptomyces]|uniref:ATP synthase F0 subunit B n=1 Tax=Streptomyces TaxID=1883 RepID=UPI00140786F3|nr:MULTISPECIES: cell division initiation protein [Streptomyces]MDH6224763.1 cell division septum initiation protein DivIVA [Streptomyces sp. MJP52]
MDVQNKLDEIVGMVSGARSMPMSASCVVNRAELLAMLEEVREALPGSLAQAQELIGGRETMVQQARQEADRIVEGAHAERASLIAGTEIARQAQQEAERILAEAQQQAEEIRAEADDYVDSKLANFEVVLTKTLGSVGRGREKLLGTGPGLDENGYEDEDAPERSHDPETLRRDADSYVDAKLGAFEAVLAKTLEAVGRGRDKLQGRIASDALADLPTGEDGMPLAHESDEDYLAGLADAAQAPDRRLDRHAEQAPPAHQPQYGRQPSYEQPRHQPAYEPQAAQDPYGYQQPQPAAASYGGYEQQPQHSQGYGYDYQQADPYAAYGQQPQQQPQAQQGYEQDYGGQDGYGAPAPARALDETSFFDTGMITPEQMRAYEQGRGQ